MHIDIFRISQQTDIIVFPLFFSSPQEKEQEVFTNYISIIFSLFLEIPAKLLALHLNDYLFESYKLVSEENICAVF